MMHNRKLQITPPHLELVLVETEKEKSNEDKIKELIRKLDLILENKKK